MARDDLTAKLAEARRVLMQIPGVDSVGYGYKERGGQTTGELSFRVYVHEKKPISALALHEVVPPEFAGIPTDVLLVIYSVPFACASTDYKAPLVGGLHISNLKSYLSTPPGGVGNLALGTLGFFGTQDASSSRNRYVLLTNQHVLVADGASPSDEIYHPQLTVEGGQAKIKKREDEHPIANIVAGGVKDNVDYTYDDGTTDGKYFVDAGTATIKTCYWSWCHTNSGTRLENTILGLDLPNPKPGSSGKTSAIEGIERLRKEDAPKGKNVEYKVYKVGAVTGKTVGKIKGVTEKVTEKREGLPDLEKTNCIVIENVGPNCGNGTLFANEGDSGAVIVNDRLKVIGLLFGGDPASGEGHACHIHPVLAQLKISLISPSNPIGASASGTLLELEATPFGDPLTAARAATLRRRILESERGRAYHRLFETHQEEVLYLVNHVRPVTVAWHRVQGPNFVAHAVHASHHPDHRVPKELEGVTREQAVARLQEAFERHGSPRLRADIAAYAEEVHEFVDHVDDLEAFAERFDQPRIARDVAPE